MLYSQCFDCNKNIGEWTDESAMDIEKTIDGIVFLVDSGGFTSSRINKYDFNCNLLWSKNFGYHNVSVEAVTSDEFGNIYIVIHKTDGTTGGPWSVDGFMMSNGLNLYKLNSSGTILWYKNIGPGVGYDMQNIFYHQGELFVTGTFYQNLTFENGVSFSFPYTDNPRAFIAKYDTNGSFLNAINYGNASNLFRYSEIDNQGNIYLTDSHSNGSFSKIYKFNSSLQFDLSIDLSSNPTLSNNIGIYKPTGIHFNSENNKLYVWGRISLTTNIMGNTFFVSNSNGVFQSVLTEFNTTNGNLENIQRFDNTASYFSNAFPSAVPMGRGAHMAERDGYLYILTSFRGTMVFPNGTTTSTTYNNNMYSQEELLLFRVKLSDFTSEFLFKSYGVQNLSFGVSDLPGPIVFNGDDLYLTATFGSTPMQINGATINNNSGNHNPDAMYYKFNINSTSSVGDFSVNNTCLNSLTTFNLNGTFDSVLWNFGDLASPNNSATINNPQHLFSGPGNYHVSVTVTCGTNTQTVEKDIVITNTPTINQINPIVQCETVYGSGISSEFDTSTINSQLIGSQLNTTIEYRNSNGVLLSSPLPNPYTNTNIGGDVITAKVFFSNNPNCYAETNIQFSTLPKSLSPTTNSPQTFCIQQNATINDIIITGQNIKWYDAPTGGNLLSSTIVLQNGVTYYASQTLNSCESSLVPVTINTQNTPAPTANSPQLLCASHNPTLNDIVVNGTDINWYSTDTSTTVLPSNTVIVDGTTYHATQTVNGCESVNRFPITISLIYSLNAIDCNVFICDNQNNGSEIVNLSLYNFEMASLAGNTFTYYTSFNGADNQITSEQLPTNHTISLGQTIVYVRIDNINGCYQIVKLELTMVSIPIIIMPEEFAFCEGSSVTISAPSGFDLNVWSTNVNATSITVNQAGNYWLMVGNSYGNATCTSTKNFTVVLSNAPTITSIDTIDWTNSENSITVNVSGLGDYEYSIDGLNFQNSNVFNGLPNGAYLVTVRDKKECGTDTQQVFLLNYPKFFTPNSDGNNDGWSIKFSQFEPNFEVRIFDRYGKLLRIMKNNEAWDGNYNGRQLPSDDYWFYVIRNDGQIHKGHFAMLR